MNSVIVIVLALFMYSLTYLGLLVSFMNQKITKETFKNLKIRQTFNDSCQKIYYKDCFSDDVEACDFMKTIACVPTFNGEPHTLKIKGI